MVRRLQTPAMCICSEASGDLILPTLQCASSYQYLNQNNEMPNVKLPAFPRREVGDMRRPGRPTWPGNALHLPTYVVCCTPAGNLQSSVTAIRTSRKAFEAFEHGITHCGTGHRKPCMLCLFGAPRERAWTTLVALFQAP